MVRLEVIPAILRAITLLLFQFLNGAIGSPDPSPSISAALLFQFLNGAIGRPYLPNQLSNA